MLQSRIDYFETTIQKKKIDLSFLKLDESGFDPIKLKCRNTKMTFL